MLALIYFRKALVECLKGEIKRCDSLVFVRPSEVGMVGCSAVNGGMSDTGEQLLYVICGDRDPRRTGCAKACSVQMTKIPHKPADPVSGTVLAPADLDKSGFSGRAECRMRKYATSVLVFSASSLCLLWLALFPGQLSHEVPS